MKTVSLCVVALNEERYLPKLLNDFVNQDYPHNCIDIVLIDSNSNDDTKKIMNLFSTENKDFRSVRVFDNPKRIQSSGWNVAISNFNTDLLIRIDAHSRIPADFVTNNVSNILSGEYVSGGVRKCIIEKENLWSRMLLASENSLFGSSFNKSRRSTKKQYVKTFFHACYAKEVIEKTGFFNEHLLRTEDNEYHFRIRQNGFRFSYDPKIESFQYARPSLLKMIKQKFQNGYWIGKTVWICPKCLSLFYFAPLLFVFFLIFLSFLSFLTPYPLLILIGIYFLFCLFNTIVSSIIERFSICNILMPIVFFLMHVSYGAGTIIGLFSIKNHR